MKMIEYTTKPGGRRTGFFIRAAALAMALPLAACNDLLEVETPDIVTPGSLTGPAGRDALYAGAIGDFVLAYAGAAGDGSFSGGVVSSSATFTDEVFDSDTFLEREEVDIRNIALTNREVSRVFTRLQRARASLERAAARLQEAASTAGAPDNRIGELLALAGYTYVSFAELFCSGVPISTATDAGELEFGAPQDRTAVLTTAVQRFDAALANPGGTAAIQNLARVGKARAQADLADYAGAATTAAPVPQGFVYQLFHSITASTAGAVLINGFRQANFIRRGISVSNSEGTNGLDFRSANDPRVPTTQDARGGLEAGRQLFLLGRYAITGATLDRPTPTPLASRIEARLIQAEAANRSGGAGFAQTLSILNDLRLNNAPAGTTLLPLVDPVTPAARVDLIFRERAFWLYATGHRLGDFRRLIRDYGRTANTVFPVGPYPRGGTYGTDVNFPIPFDEQNNPNFEQCINRDP